MTKITELNYELLEHSPYSLDMASSEYYLFPNLKKCLSGKHFKTNNTVVDGYFAPLPDLSMVEKVKVCF